MRKFLLIAFVCLCFLGSTNATAKPGEEPVSPVQVRDMANGLSGVTVNGGQTADKLVYLGHNVKGELVILGIAALAPGSAEGIEPAKETIAILRTRATTNNGNKGPDAADLALARALGITIYVIGEWSEPPKLWQISFDGTVTQMREIDSSGRVGEWQAEGA